MDQSSTGRAAVVEFEHVTKRYDAPVKRKDGKTPQTPGAVNDLSLTVPAGKICVLVGPSGCGKTTVLKMVNRLIEPTSGRILIDGVDAATPGRSPSCAGASATSSSRSACSRIRPSATTWRPCRACWAGRRTACGRARTSCSSLVGLDPAKYRDRFPNQLSGGERQRVGVARALAVDPPIMLMDEPFGAVDPIVRDRLQNEFLRLQEELAKTILFVTHDIDEAIKIGDLVAVFQDGGMVAQFGTPAEILADPASEFVARFVGADRGLKRLALSRVSDLDLDPAGDRRSSVRTPRARASARTPRRSATSCWSTRHDGRWAGSPRRRSPTSGPLDRGARQPGLALGQQADDAQGRALDDARRGRAGRDRGRPHRRGPGDHDRRAGSSR